MFCYLDFVFKCRWGIGDSVQTSEFRHGMGQLANFDETRGCFVTYKIEKGRKKGNGKCFEF